MLVSFDKRFFFRSIVRFTTVAERDAILAHLAGIKGKVFAYENRETPFKSDANPEKYSVMVCDFQMQVDRDSFELFLTPDLTLGTEKRVREVRALPKEPTIDSEYDLTKTRARRRFFSANFNGGVKQAA